MCECVETRVAMLLWGGKLLGGSNFPRESGICSGEESCSEEAMLLWEEKLLRGSNVALLRGSNVALGWKVARGK